MLKPLFINRNYRFDDSPGGECLRAFIGAMDKLEWSPMVYASDRTPLVEPVEDFVTMTHERRYVQYEYAAIRRVLPDLTFLPDYVWSAWGKRASKQVVKDIQRGVVAPDYIHSVSYPVASQWAALKVKRATGLPWVMQFYDPWADSPFRPFRTKWLKSMDWAMEREAVDSADLIIHDNEIIADIWRERYGAEIAKKIVVLPLTVALPNTKVEERRRAEGEPLVISHIGNFTSVRKAKPFINGVLELLQNHPELKSMLRVNFIGQVYDDDKDLIRMNNLTDIFKLHGTLPIEECEKFYQETDVFLAEEGVTPDNRFFFPSKILKYFYFQRPILGISPKGSVLDYELRKSGHCVFDNSDNKGIAEYLYRAITDYESILNFDRDYWHRFEPCNVVSEYETLIKEMLKHCR